MLTSGEFARQAVDKLTSENGMGRDVLVEFLITVPGMGDSAVKQALAASLGGAASRAENVPVRQWPWAGSLTPGFYLLATAKAGAAERFAADPVAAAVVAAAPAVLAEHVDIQRRVEIASRSGFKGAHLMRCTEADAA